VDWDWEDGPPRDTPPSRRRPDEPGPGAEPGPPASKPPESGPPESMPLETGPPEPLDETVTQVFSADAAWEQTGEQAPIETAPHAPPPEYVLPDRTETGRPSAQGDAEFAYLPPDAADVGAERERRPRSPQDRAARREQRRRQLRRRRLVALAILVAIVVLILFLVIRGCGGSDAGAAATVFVTAFVDRRLLVVPGRM